MKKNYLLITICFSLISCGNYVLEKIGVYEETAKTAIISDGNKKVIIIGMQHVGQQKFYDDVKFKIDSLRALGFHFLFESAMYDVYLTNEEAKIYNLKARKLIGVHLSGKGILDTIENKIGNIKVNPKYQLVNQPKPTLLGLDLNNDVRADLPMNALIDMYEIKFGKIELDECDFNTPLEERYSCATWKKGDINYLILDARNEEIIERIVKSNHNKIAVVYGKKHIEGIVKLLKEKDNNWQYE